MTRRRNSDISGTSFVDNRAGFADRELVGWDADKKRRKRTLREQQSQSTSRRKAKPSMPTYSFDEGTE